MNKEKRKNYKKNLHLNSLEDKYYKENEEAYITINVESIEDIISFYNIKDYEWINNDLANYLEEQSYYIPNLEPIVIEISGEKFNEEEKQKIEKTMKAYFEQKLGKNIIDINQNTKRAILLFISGIFSFLVLQLLVRISLVQFLSEISVLVFWFFIWECVNTLTIDRNELQNDKIGVTQLSNAKIVFTED